MTIQENIKANAEIDAVNYELVSLQEKLHLPLTCDETHIENFARLLSSKYVSEADVREIYENNTNIYLDRLLCMCLIVYIKDILLKPEWYNDIFQIAFSRINKSLTEAFKVIHNKPLIEYIGKYKQLFSYDIYVHLISKKIYDQHGNKFIDKCISQMNMAVRTFESLYNYYDVKQMQRFCKKIQDKHYQQLKNTQYEFVNRECQEVFDSAMSLCQLRKG